MEVRIGARTNSMAVHDAETRGREENSRAPLHAHGPRIHRPALRGDRHREGRQAHLRAGAAPGNLAVGRASRAMSALVLSIHYESLRGLITPLVSAPHLADNDELGMQTRPKLKQLSCLSFSHSCHLLKRFTNSKGRSMFKIC